MPCSSPPSPIRGVIFASTITSWSSRSSARAASKVSLNTTTSACAAPSSSVTNAILPRRPFWIAQRGDDAGDQHRLLRAAASAASGVRDQRRELRGVARVRMPGQVEAERRLLVRQPLALGPRRASSTSRCACAGVAASPNRMTCARRARRCSAASSAMPTEANRLARRAVDRIERAGADQRLDDAAVDHAACRRAGRNRTGRGTARPPRARATMAAIADSPVPLIRAQAVADALARPPARSGRPTALMSGGSTSGRARRASS